MLTGRITAWDGQNLTIQAAFNDTYIMEQRNPKECEVRLIDSRAINADQRKKAYALMRDISVHTGYSPKEIKEVMKYDFISHTGYPEFSLSDVDLSTAREFIDHMVEFCLEYGVQCKDSLLDQAEDVGKYLYLCLYHKKCCVCGTDAEIHHVDAVGMGSDREEICHIGYRAMALCRIHHSKAHSNPDFAKLHHVYGIKLDKVLVKRLRLGDAKGDSNAS